MTKPTLASFLKTLKKSSKRTTSSTKLFLHINLKSSRFCLSQTWLSYGSTSRTHKIGPTQRKLSTDVSMLEVILPWYVGPI